MPLSAIGLCDALIITPAAPPVARVTHATAGVGTIPSDVASRPTEVIPAMRAASSMVPETRVSRPTRIGLRPSPSSGKTLAAARPIRMASSGVSSRFATPRTPSVPKSRFT